MNVKSSTMKFGFNALLFLALMVSLAMPMQTARAIPPLALAPTYTLVVRDTGTAAVSDEQAHSYLHSVKMTTTTSNDGAYIRFAFAPGELTLDELTTFTYWEWQHYSSSPLDVFVDIWLDFNNDGVADANDYNGYLQAEPYYVSGASAKDTWTQIDAMGLKWSTYVGPDDPYDAPTIADFQANASGPCVHGYTMADWNGGVDFGPLDILRIDVRVGYGGPWVNFTGYADDIVINDYTQSFDPAQVWVDDDFTPATTGWGYDHFAVIQDGIDSITAGGIVNVAAGTYNEHVNIGKALSLLGANSGVDGRTTRSAESIIDGSGTDAPLAILANDVTIDGFKIQAGANGGYMSGVWIAGTSERWQILNNVITDNAIGVFAQCAGDCLLQRNLFLSNNRTGPSGGAAIYNENSIGLTIDRNEFINHTENNPVLFAATGNPAHTNLVFTGNSLHDNAYGIYALAIDGGTFTGNTIDGSTGTALGFGGGSNDITVEGNTFTNNARGLRMDDDGYGFGNNSNFEVHLNKFVGNTDYGVGNNGGYTGDLAAEHNWWGAVSGPGSVGIGSGDKVSTNVDYSPWCINAACTLFAPPFDTLTTITADTPDPSLLNQTVMVTAKVEGLPAGALTPTGTVTISGGVADCTITLVGGTGSCGITFDTGGAKTITATYNPDTADFITSSDTESHNETLIHTYTSQGLNDGWIIESSEISGVGGGSLAPLLTTFWVGDYDTDRQIRSVLSFNTSGLPNNAVITKVTLKIKKQSLVGTDPFLTLGNLLVDIRKPYFGSTAALALNDFEAVPSKAAVGFFGSTPVGYWYSAGIQHAGFPYINLGGITQFRLRFAIGDNNNDIADYLKFYSGDYASVNAWPTLIIEYQIP